MSSMKVMNSSRKMMLPSGMGMFVLGQDNMMSFDNVLESVHSEFTYKLCLETLLAETNSKQQKFR